MHDWWRAAREGLLAMPEDDSLVLVPIVAGASGGTSADVTRAVESGAGRVRCRPSRPGDRGASGGLASPQGGIARAYLATRPVDFRMVHAGLALIVQNVPGHDPCNGTVHLFRLWIGPDPGPPLGDGQPDELPSQFAGLVGSR